MVDQSKILYEDDEHQVIWFGWEDHEHESLVQSNQLLVINADNAYLFDPGGAYIFSEVASEVAKYIPLSQIRYILATHQDPDVLSSITLWLKSTNARLLVSRLWIRFVSHFGFSDNSRLVSIEDHGKQIRLDGNEYIKLLPAHFLHSEGNFCFYDTRSKILFTGDIGAAVFPKGERYLEVSDWETHVSYMEGFHKRYMGNNLALRRWIQSVRHLEISSIVPQHGAIIPKEMVPQFFAWLEQLECGTDLLDQIYDNALA
ncbi:Metallo-beta-lactamase superfamily protein [Oceanospirillum multiglobuliferum]|uniref:MBL fold metallo-hydrolase n=1 Tax=Oceanospirillum multiglobuliferum TaxID=64969 RepID=A0A1T4S3L6_9GAMM|nr:MBL fold metallo-hydrolase [Oceanospirillum multiglobuliferum]OPX54480.1 MBL fold metallo-hydrolase [Oceanospirillum multiglobuliferum]SKA22411.1 Metallo-beta-lactamase superfamily protein [Oceanospirillum multiglobuliferum]